MPPLLDETGLREAISTTVVQLCKVGVAYQSDLSIKGTIGVTVDKRQVILVHLDEHFETGQYVVESSQTQTIQVESEVSGSSDIPVDATLVRAPISSGNILRQDPMISSVGVLPGSGMPRVVSVAATSGSTSSFMTQSQPPILPPILPPISDSQTGIVPALGSLAVPISFWQHAMRSVYSQVKVPQNANPNLADSANLANLSFGSSMQDSTHDMDCKIKTLTETVAIDLDSDSESFSPLNFEDEDDGTDKTTGWMEKKEPPTSDTEQNDLMCQSDVKNIILIEDGTDLMQDGCIDQSETDAVSVTDDYERYRSALPKLNIPVKAWPSPIQLKVEALEGARVLASVSDVPMNQNDDTESEQGDQLGIGRITGGWPWEMARKDKSQTNTPSECEVCHKTFAFVSSAHLECHLVETHNITISRQVGPIPHKCCPHCDKKFRFQATLEKHLFVHVDQKPFKCTKCPNAYCYAESLDIHKVSHDGNLTCQICNSTYANRKLFQKHIKYMHEMRRSTRKSNKKS